jgi:hypothetical protein
MKRLRQLPQALMKTRINMSNNNSMHSTPLTRLEKNIRLSAILVCIALIVTIISLLVDHPLSFIGFAVAGVLVILVAIAYYLLALVRVPRKISPEKTG